MNPNSLQSEKRGRLIVIEGPDGAGKTSIGRAFLAYLNSASASHELLGFPGNAPGTLGKLVYDLHHSPEDFGLLSIHPASLQILHIAAHIDAIDRVILPSLTAGINIILDRYWWSTWVYGTLADFPLTPLEQLIQVEKHFWRDQDPDILLIIDRDVSFRESVSDANWTQLRSAYHRLREIEEGKYPIKVIKNEGSLEETLEKVISTYRQISSG